MLEITTQAYNELYISAIFKYLRRGRITWFGVITELLCIVTFNGTWYINFIVFPVQK